MALKVDKWAFICCFPVDTCFQLFPNLNDFHSDERQFAVVCNFHREVNCTKTTVPSWKKNKQRSAPGDYKQENCPQHQSSRPPLINEQCVDYKFKCDLCDADYVGYTCRHLLQCIEEHKHSAIGNTCVTPTIRRTKIFRNNLPFLKKCRRKFECFIYKMLFIRQKKPELNTQSNSIKAKLFIQYLIITLFVPHFSAFNYMQQDFHTHS